MALLLADELDGVVGHEGCRRRDHRRLSLVSASPREGGGSGVVGLTVGDEGGGADGLGFGVSAAR